MSENTSELCIDLNLNPESILKELRHKLNHFLSNTPLYNLSNVQASQTIDTLSKVILTHNTRKDIAIVCFLYIQKILGLISNSTEQFLTNFILLSQQFGFVNDGILFDPTVSLLQLSSDLKSNDVFIKLIFLREFVVGKDPIISHFLFSQSLQNSIIYQFFFKQLLTLYQNDDNIYFYITNFYHALIQWLDSVMLFFNLSSYTSNIPQTIFHENSEFSTFIVAFVWKFIEEPLPGISENSKIILQNYFRLYQRYCTWSGQDPKLFDKFLTNTLQIPWTSKGRYIFLHTLIEFLPPSLLLTKHTNLTNELTYCMSTTNLYTAATDLYKSLIKDISVETWKETWLYLFMKTLLSNDMNERYHLAQYWLPATLKSIPQSSQTILETLYAISIHTNSHITERIKPLILFENTDYTLQGLYPSYTGILYATIQYLKYCITLDIIKLTDCCIPILRDGLSSGDEYIRIEALSIVLTDTFHSSQTWRCVLIQEFLSHNLNPSSSTFRQKLSLLINKSIINIQTLLVVKMPKNKFTQTTEYFYNQYSDLIHTLSFYKSCSLQCLLPNSPFQKVTLGLSIYQSLVNSFIRPVENKKSHSKSSRAKLDIYTVLSRLEFELLTLSDLTLITLCLISDYFEIRDMTAAILSPNLSNMNTLSAIDHVFPVGLYNTAKKLITSSRVYEGETGALLFKLHLSLSIEESQCINPVKVHYGLCIDLLAMLSIQFVSAQKNILEAAHKAPLFSAVTAINSVLTHKVNGDVIGVDWQQYLTDLVSILDDVITFSLTTLTGYSNEDVLAPSFADMGVAIETAVLSVEKNNEDTTHHTDCSSLSYQLVLNCVWLALREACSLLGSLPGVFGVTGVTAVDKSVLVVTTELVEKIGTILVAILTKCRHVGAILTCQSALTKFCFSLSDSNIPLVCCLNYQWLDKLINTITCQDVKSSISRQGAGLPFCVQSILCSESKQQHKPLLRFAMEKLLTFSAITDTIAVADTQDLVAVRCMNILRILYRDSTVGSRCVMSYGERGLSLAVTSMRSSLWSVSNAGMMLFGALAVRMLGQRRLSEGTTELSTITLGQLFTRFPLTKSLFLSQLRSPSDRASTDIHAAVYPVLQFLCKLTPSPNYHFSEKACYIRSLQLYTQSAVYLVRCKASLALAMFLYTPCVDTVLLHLLEKLPHSKQQCVSYNFVHGLLELLAELIRLHYVLYRTGSSSVLILVHQCISRCNWLISMDTPMVIRNVYFSIVRMLDSEDLTSSLLVELSKYTIVELIHNINLCLSAIEFYIAKHITSTQHSNELVVKLFNDITDYTCLCTELMGHPIVLPWLYKKYQSTYCNLFKRLVHTLDSLSDIDVCCCLEIVAEMIEQLITLDSDILTVEFNLLTNCVLRCCNPECSIRSELSCLQISSLLLIHRIHNPLLVVVRESELIVLFTKLLNRHGRFDSTEDSRIISVRYLTKLFSSIVLSSPVILQSISTILFVILNKIILLLQDEVVEIRSLLATNISSTLNIPLPLDNRIVMKQIFIWIADTLYRYEDTWKLLLQYISGENCINIYSVKDGDVLFEKGKDNIYGEDRVNCENAFKSLLSMSDNLQKSEMSEGFILYLLEFIKTQSAIFSTVTTQNSLDTMLHCDPVLFKKIVGVFCVVKLVERLVEKVPDTISIPVQLIEKSCLVSLFMNQIEYWMHNT